MRTVVEFPAQGIVAEEAAEWLVRLDGDSPPTSQELETLGHWLHRSPAHREELERLATLWNRMNVLTDLAMPPGEHLPEARETRIEGSSVRKWAPRLRPALVGACVIGTFALGLFWLMDAVFEDRITSANGLYATAIGQQSTTALPDDSQILLNTNSQIRVDYGERYREVHLLQGEALFIVAKDSGRPFRVYAGSGRIQAIGTAFSVYVKGADVEVTVTEGRVALASTTTSRTRSPQSPRETPAGRADGGAPSTSADDEGSESLGTLSAGQVATIRGSGGDELTPPALTAIQPIPPDKLAERLAWRNGILTFSGDRLEDVVREVSRYTAVSIEIPDAAIRNRRVGGRFPVGETDVMLAALETNFELKVTHVGLNRVVVTAAEE